MGDWKLRIIYAFLFASTAHAGIIENSLGVGELVAGAIKLYKQLEGEYRATASVTIDNFLDRPLTQCDVIQTKGITKTTVPMTIRSGYKQSFVVQQNKPGAGLDMIFTCRMKSDNQTLLMMIHFDINQQVAGRKPNELGLAVVSDEDNNFYTSFVAVMSDSESYTRSQQCAVADVAVQATMTTSHQSKIRISVYPKLAENFAIRTKKAWNVAKQLQDQLDQITDFPQSCLNSDDFGKPEINDSGSTETNDSRTSYNSVSSVMLLVATIGHVLVKTFI